MKRKYKIPKEFKMDGEVVDNLAVYSLKWHYNSLVKEMDNFILKEQGHPEDYQRNLRLTNAFKLILEEYYTQ